MPVLLRDQEGPAAAEALVSQLLHHLLQGGRRPDSKSHTTPVKPRAMHSRKTSWQKGGVGPRPSKLRQSRNMNPPLGAALPLIRNRWGPFPMR